MKENILLLSPQLLVLPRCIEKMLAVLKENDLNGAVWGNVMQGGSFDLDKFKIAIKYARDYQEKDVRAYFRVMPYEAVLIRNELLRKNAKFDEILNIPQKIMEDYSYRGEQLNYKYCQVQSAFFYRMDEAVKYEDIYDEG